MSEALGTVYDDVGQHLQAARSFDRAAVPLGMYVAWCANHQLLSETLAEQAAGLVMRVRFREITGSELTVAGCGGVLAAEHLNDEGRAFTEAFYPCYLDEFRAVFGSADPYAVKDDWEQYDRISPLLTRALMGFRQQDAGSRIGSSGGKPAWWKFWS